MSQLASSHLFFVILLIPIQTPLLFFKSNGLTQFVLSLIDFVVWGCDARMLRIGVLI